LKISASLIIYLWSTNGLLSWVDHLYGIAPGELWPIVEVATQCQRNLTGFTLQGRDSRLESCHPTTRNYQTERVPQLQQASTHG
jgi:hypothetical protein